MDAKSGRAEHHFGAPRAPARGVGCEIARAEIGFRLDDASRTQRVSVIVHQVHADQGAGNGERAAFEEATLRFATANHRIRE